MACVSARQERKIREKNIPLKGRKEIYPVLPNKAFDCTLRAALGLEREGKKWHDITGNL